VRPDDPPARATPDAPAKALVARRILVNALEAQEIRVAILENGRLDEIFYERPSDESFLGNIYKGRIVNLEPAIQAAFVDIGIGRNGFLHVSDVLPIYREATAIPVDKLSERGERKRLKIQEILRRGQEVLVQISKESIGAKGPSLTTYVSVPGKYLVLMPGVSRHGVSKRIEDSDERALLREKLAGLNPPEGIGYIVRTAGQDRPHEVLEKDFNSLMTVWTEIVSKVRQVRAPSLLYAESDLVTRTLRDLSGSETEDVLIDDEAVYQRAKDFLEDVMPAAVQRLHLVSGPVPLFTRYGVEAEIEKIYNRRVPLPSGGHLVIEQTEALVAIDVNSGRYRDEEDLEATALKTNLEAADEIARQLRLRDLGGVIINDFIDMEVYANRREVERALRAALKKDHAKSWITRISRFGIIEMTRQRVGPSIERSHHEPCKCCGGKGTVRSARSTSMAVLRQLRAELATKRRHSWQVAAHPDVAGHLLNERRRSLSDLEAQYDKRILILPDASLAPDQFELRSQ
jgi:ribonuclease E